MDNKLKRTKRNKIKHQVTLCRGNELYMTVQSTMGVRKSSMGGESDYLYESSLHKLK